MIGLIGAKNLKNAKKPNNTINTEENKSEQKTELYTGNIRCEMLDKNDEIYETYFIENIEVENDKVKTNEIKRKVLNPVYDDENLIVEYIINERFTMHDEDVNEYINDLKTQGYKCEKVID